MALSSGKSFTLLLSTLTILSSCSREGLSQKQRTLISRCLSLDHPYKVTRWNIAADGGSVVGQIEGRKGNGIGFVWDRSIATHSRGTPRHVYVATSPDCPKGGVKLEVGSECETAFILVLRDFADHLLPRSEQDSLVSITGNLMIPEGRRYAATRHLTQEQRMGLAASRLATSLENQRSKSYRDST
jgi:hypothetical protein